MSNEEKQSDSTEEKGEELSRALVKLYRLAYESLIDKSNCDINKEYEIIAKEFTEIFKSVKPPTTTEQLIAIIEKCKSNGKNDYIYDMKNTKEENKEAKVALVEYCVADNIDTAILYLLNYKLKNGSCSDIVNYVHSESAGWSSYSYAAIHKVISHINRSAYSYKNKDEILKQFDIEKVDWNLDDTEKNKIKERNKPKEEKRDKYISNIIDSKYGKTVFLIEILLRENCSTTLKSDASGWRVAAKNETVFNAALSSNNIDVLRSIFTYGIDIDANEMCKKNVFAIIGYVMATSKDSTIRRSWKVGSNVEIYSNSQKKWFQGTITKIYTKNKVEWLKLSYGGYEKEILRYDSKIRPYQKRYKCIWKERTETTAWMWSTTIYEAICGRCTTTVIYSGSDKAERDKYKSKTACGKCQQKKEKSSVQKQKEKQKQAELVKRKETQRKDKQIEALNYQMNQMNLKLEQNNNYNIVNNYNYNQQKAAYGGSGAGGNMYIGLDDKGRKLYRGPLGGVYYVSNGGNKVYVQRR